MLTTKEVRGVRVCHPLKPGKEYTKDGVPRHRRKIGKIYKTVFSPDGMRVVGFIVRRPDLLWMFKRPEQFLKLENMKIVDGLITPKKGMVSLGGSEEAVTKALEKIGVDWNKCILWEGIEVKTPEGRELGRVDEISFDEETGDVNSMFLDDGGAARALVGSIEIPAELVIGYKKGYLIVKAEAAQLLPTGGLAAKAGEASAKAAIDAKEAGAKAGKAVGEAVDKGSVGLGRTIGRMKRSVTDAVDGFKEESGANERAAAKAAAEKAPAKKASASGAKTSGVAKASGTAKTAKTGGSGSSASGSTKKKTASGTAASAGKAVGNHLKAAGSMFSDFKSEFDKASKGK